MTAPLLGDGVTPERPVGVSEGPSAGEGIGEAQRAAEALAVALTEAFKPVSEFRRPAPRDESAMVVFTATDGHSSMRALTFGEIADAVLAAGFRLVSEDDDTVEPRARVDRRDELAYKIQRAVEVDPEVIRYDEDDWTRIADVVMDLIDELQRAASRELIDSEARQELTDAADFIERHVSQVGPAAQELAPGQSFAVKLLRDRAALRGCTHG